jgi:PKD repeat protein
MSLLVLSFSSKAHENKKDKDHKKPQPPVATFAATQLTFVSPFKVKFDASASSSQVGPIHDYIWDFGDDSRHPHFDCQDERREHRGGAHRPIVEHAYRKPGVYRVTLKVVDKRGGHAKVYKDIRVVLPAPPIAKLSVSPSASGVAPFFALLDASASSSPVGLPLTYKFTFGDGQVVTTPSAQLGHPYNLVGSYVATVRVTDSAGLFSEKSISITVTAPVIPPAPVAPPQTAAAPQSFDQRASFIYQGPNAVQTGVLPGAIKTNRVSLLRGRVLDDLNQPLSGVVITVFGQSQLGHTLSRANGEFDLAVNGGELPVTIKYNRSGYTPAQRTLKIPVLDHVAIGDVLLSRYDSKATTVQMNAAANQVHTASTVSDSDGARTATIVVKPQTTAQLIMPDGSSRAVNQLSIRATEVTVGTDGPKRMPADLPTNTGYTYAVDLTADEAIALGAKSIEFSKPVAFHLDNFLNIPVGFIVPSGYLDQAKGFWTPEIDGRVIRVLNVSAGLAQIDIYGSGQPANAQELTILGVDSDELRALASYPVGKTLWRVPIRHFSFFDFNFAQIPFGPHMENSPVASNPPCANACCVTAAGCEIDIGRRVWREKIPLLGSGLDLHYSSDRTSGWFGDSVVAATLLKGVPPSQLNYIDVNTTIAGRTFKSHILKNGNMDYQLTWDGLDGFGREVTQPATATVNLEYNFTVVYRVPLGGNLIANPPAKTFNSPWDPTAIGQTFPSRDLFIYKQTMTMDVTPPNSFLAENAKREVGGWTFAQHHQYDAVRKRLYLGTGHIVDIKALPQIVQDVAGGGANLGDGGLALGSALRLPVYYRRNADGTAYISDYGHSRIRKIGTDGVISTYAGTGVSGNTGDGGPASAAQIGAPVGILPSPDGSIYFGDATQHVVRKIDANGIISTVAGTGVAGFSGDGGPA